MCFWRDRGVQWAHVRGLKFIRLTSTSCWLWNFRQVSWTLQVSVFSSVKWELSPHLSLKKLSL
jgi:hypothetical protein